MATEGLVNKIIPFSSVDGPGNRTAIFLQGCNFDCRYCHNPETIHLCVSCGVCVEKCPTGALTWVTGQEDMSQVHHADGAAQAAGRLKDGYVAYDIEKCVLCDACIKNCPHGSSPRIRHMTAADVMAVVRKQLPYIRGITVSGGECTRQRDFLVELFTMAGKEGLDCLLDSNGTLDFSTDEELTALTDGVMLDIKAFSLEEHQTITGRDNEMVWKNAEYLASVGKLPEIRTVIVPGLYDYETSVRQTAKRLQPYLSVAPIRYKLIKYRPMGVRSEYAVFKTPSQDVMDQLAGEVEKLGFLPVISG
jgi:pyruvate formate lyase activating enzyme